jgi:hypothetical protein
MRQAGHRDAARGITRHCRRLNRRVGCQQPLRRALPPRGEVGEISCFSTLYARVRSRALRRKIIEVHQLRHVARLVEPAAEADAARRAQGHGDHRLGLRDGRRPLYMTLEESGIRRKQRPLANSRCNTRSPVSASCISAEAQTTPRRYTKSPSGSPMVRLRGSPMVVGKDENDRRLFCRSPTTSR